MKELYVGGVFTEDRAMWKEELHKHCQELYVDVHETIEKQEDRIKKYKTDGDRHFAGERRISINSIDLVLEASAKMAEESVKGSEDSIVTEMINGSPQKQQHQNPRCFQDRLMDLGRAVWLQEDREVGLVAEARFRVPKRNEKLQGHRAGISDVEVVCDLKSSTFGKRKRT